MVTAGARNVRGTIQEPVETTALASGQPQSTWEAIATDPIEYAEVKPFRGGEFLRAQQITGETTGKIRFRYRSDLTETMRFLTDEGAAWHFKSPPADPDGRRREIEITVVKRA